MAKQKFEIVKVLTGEATGVLDYGTDGKVVIVTDGIVHDFQELIDTIIGAEVQIKFSREILE